MSAFPRIRQSVSQWVSETNIRLEPPRHLCGIIWVINQLSKCSRIPFGHHDAPELLWRGCAFCLLLFLWRVAVCVYVCVRECLRESTLTGWDCNSPPPPSAGRGAPKETPVLAEAQPAWLSAGNPSLGSIRKNYEPSPEVCLRFLPRSLSFLWQNSCRRVVTFSQMISSDICIWQTHLPVLYFRCDTDSYAGGGVGDDSGIESQISLELWMPEISLCGWADSGENAIAFVNIKAHISLGFKSALPALHKFKLFWIFFHYVPWQSDFKKVD